MTRLFISLYLIVVIGLLAIGWGSEKIWDLLNPQSGQTEQTQQQMEQLLPLTLASFDSQQKLIDGLSEVFSAPVQLFSTDEIILPSAQLTELKRNQVIRMQTQDHSLMFYLYWPEKNKMIEIGPVFQPQVNSGLRPIIKLFSYLGLALVIALWTWPLWRDLRALQSASQYFARGLFKQTVNVKKSSSIYPLAQSFQSMAEQISQLMEEQKQLVNAVSHDLRTPLSRIKFSLGILPQPTLAQLPGVQQDIKELEKLIDELLSYARLESQTQKLNLDYVDFNELIAHQTDRFRTCHQADIQINMKASVNWLCDGYLIERCINNLVSNALRYCRTKVVLSVYAEPSQLLIHVEDDGNGIAAEHYQSIFKPFTRLETSRNKGSAGFGLGLAIVQKICHWHHGDCFISKSLLGGAKFTIKLPNLESEQTSGE